MRIGALRCMLTPRLQKRFNIVADAHSTVLDHGLSKGLEKHIVSF